MSRRRRKKEQDVKRENYGEKKFNMTINARITIIKS